ncbi:MAG: hypothetical protein D6702_01870 [Planctomycetota bacterium]|nr:MAG: hypothetical protein D6702_01870 [Planctomycetota bacterium]
MNRILRLLPLALVAAVPVAPATAQNYETIAFESFDYAAGNLGGQGSGYGLLGTWWAGNTGDNAVVNVPGLDGIGGMGTSVIEHQGSYRSIDTRSLDAICENGLLGKDGTTVWVSLLSRRHVGGDALYGGLTLSWQWVGEQLTIGSPYPQEEWGLDRPWAAPAYWVTGSNIDQTTFLVCKIEFLPGDEHCMLWVDPPTEYPDPLVTPPDIDVYYPDFRFNELQLKSGYGLVHDFDQDQIKISVPWFRPVLSVTNAVAGQAATVKVENCVPGATVLVGYSLAGDGPINTPYGQIFLSPPFGQLPNLTADPAGVATMNANVPAGLAGRTVYMQAVDTAATGEARSNQLAVVIQ